MNDAQATRNVTVRCGFCDALNQLDFEQAASRPKCESCERPILLDRPLKVSDEDFERTVLRSEVPVLVDFYADWCAPCKVVAPFIDELAGEHVGKVLVAKVDTDQAQETAMKYGIRSIPTLIVFQGGEEVERSMGFEPERVRAFMEKAAS